MCEPTTGELLAEVTLDPATGALATRARAGQGAAAVTAAESVRRFAEGPLGITVQWPGESRGAAPPHAAQSEQVPGVARKAGGVGV